MSLRRCPRMRAIGSDTQRSAGLIPFKREDFMAVYFLGEGVIRLLNEERMEESWRRTAPVPEP